MNSKWLVLFGLALASFAVVVALGTSGGDISPFPVDFSVNGTPVAQRSSVNIIEGTAVTVTGVDSGLLTGVEYTVNSSSAGGVHPVNQASDITGIAPVINGGTGSSVLTASELLVGNGISNITSIATGSAGLVLTSNGAAVPSWQGATIPDFGTFDDATTTFLTTLPNRGGYNSTTDILTSNFLYQQHFFISEEITIDQIIVEVTIAAAGATAARVCLFDADTDLQPVALLAEETFDATTNGVKAMVLNSGTPLLLPVGRYVIQYGVDASTTVRTYYVLDYGSGIAVRSGMGASLYNLRTYHSAAGEITGGCNDPGSASNGTSAGTLVESPIFFRISTP